MGGEKAHRRAACLDRLGSHDEAMMPCTDRGYGDAVANEAA
jgi:hypothetical protein